MSSMRTQDDYKVRLDVFEGPLDLLLYLIKKEQGLPRHDFLFMNGLDFARDPLGVQILKKQVT